MLYGLDLAKRDIARASQAVVVEGYTDVMACHLRRRPRRGRLVRDRVRRRARQRAAAVLTIDDDVPRRGDLHLRRRRGRAEGRAAGVRGDQNFVAQTYVAVEPDGLDPCDLRLQQGDAAVRELVARRAPLYRFVLTNVVGKYDLDRADGRIDAVREAARLVASVRDQSKRTAFAQEISKMVGADIDTNQVLSEVRRAANRPAPQEQRQAPSRAAAAPGEAEAPPRRQLPNLRDPRFSIERETLKLVIQHPQAIGRIAADVGANDFTHPIYRAVWDLVAAAGGPTAGAADQGWATRLRSSATDPMVVSAISELGVDPLLKEPDQAYVSEYVYRLQELTVMRRIADLKSRLQRTNPVEHPTDYNRMFGELAALEQHRRALRERSVGAS